MQLVQQPPSGRRHVYLTDVPPEKALQQWLDALRRHGALELLPGERVPTEQALGRVTAAPVYAARSSPHYHACAVDGVALRAAETVGASETSPVRLQEGHFRFVNTGEPLPEGFDAVVMIEDVHEVAPGTIELIAAAVPWQNVRSVGEDIVAGELVLPSHHVIRPVDIGMLLAAGVLEVTVRRRPRLLIIPTGDELVEPDVDPLPGQVVEFNSRMLAAMAREWGADARRHPPVRDDPDALAQALERAAAAYDVVVINAGSSAGSRDLTAATVERLGEVVVHGVAMRPGKPTVLGVVGRAAVAGIPGYPVSAALAFDRFVRPLVHALLGLEVPRPPALTARMVRRIRSAAGIDEFVRVKLGQVGDQVIAAPLSRGAALLASLARADGMVVISRSSEGIEAGQEVTVELFRRPEEVRQTVVVVGSHDVALDVLADLLRRRRPGVSLSSAHVGSLGGLVALRRGEAHMAGIHLLDENTGEYNVPYVRRHLAGQKVLLVTLAHRQQGLMVQPGNPKGIRRLEDLIRDDVTFANRQRGSGTRMLLDFSLRTAGIDPSRIRGYLREYYTHMAVAAAVASGAADAGLGILAAARALGLEFVPLATERYDLAIPEPLVESPLVQEVLAALASDEFKEAVARLGGYDVSETGKVQVVDAAHLDP